MEKRSLFHQIERQVEEEAKEWKRRRLKELIEEHTGDAGVSPPQPSATDKKATDEH